MEKELSIFTRFLKENKLIGILKTFSPKFILEDYGEGKYKLKYNYFDNALTWSKQKEGYFFWKLIQVKYCLMLLNVYLDDKLYNFYLTNYIDSLSTGYNNDGDMKTDTDEKYIEYINDLISKM